MPKKDDAPQGGRPGNKANEIDLKPHPLVQRLQPDIDDINVPPDVVSLIGYIGTSKKPDHIRLYRDLSFNNYYEIPTSGVASTAALNPDDENSPTVVNVYADTKVEVITISAQSVEARYLSGSISSGALGGPAQIGSGGSGGGPGPCGIVPTRFPSCVFPPCANILTWMPSCIGPQPCWPIRTTGLDPVYLNDPTGMGRQAVAAQQLCGNITTHMPSCVKEPPLCLTVFTANPTDCGQPCNPGCIATVVTSGVGFQAQAAAAPACITLHTAIPSNCGGGGGQYCITLHTHYPTWCPPPPCRPVTHTAAIFCTNVTLEPTEVLPCITLHTHYPTWCPPPCRPIAHTAATLCTQAPGTVTGQGTVLCPTIATVIPTGGG